MAGHYTFGETLRHLFATGAKADSRALTQYLGEKYDGTATLYHKGRAALAEAIRVQTGGSGKVAISGLTCYSVVQAVEAAGCTPLYVDIRRDDLQPGPEELRNAFSQHNDIKAVIIQNMLGIPADMTTIEPLIKKHHVAIIEDLAHSAGAHYADGREVGTVGDIVMLSFGKDKALDTVNGGALIVKNDEAVHLPIRQPRFADRQRDRWYPVIAGLARLFYPVKLGRYIMSAAIRLHMVTRSADGSVSIDETMPHWQAKLALAQMRRLTDTVATRQTHTNRYQHILSQFIPSGALQAGASLARVPLLVEEPQRLIRILIAHGIYAPDVWYDIPVSPIRFYAKANYPEAACPVAVDTAKHLINLPTHHRVTEKHIKTIQSITRKELQI